MIFDKDLLILCFEQLNWTEWDIYSVRINLSVLTAGQIM